MNLPEKNTNWKHLWWQLPLLLVVCFAAYTSSGRFNEQVDSFLPETVANCSTNNAQGSGYRAFYELCQRVGLKPLRFEESYRELGGQKAVLVIVAPSFPLLSSDIERILKWVEDGNELVYLDYCMYGAGRELLDRLDIKILAMMPLEDAVQKVAANRPEMQHVSQLVLSSETRLVGGESLLSDNHGALIVAIPHGKGRCMIATLPNLCSNRRISDRKNWGNFQFLINWLQSTHARVLFDERVHGYLSSQSVFAYLARGPVGFIILQLSLIFLLSFLSLNQRFGPIRVIAQKRKIAASEFIDGMASTYQKARAYDAALAILYGSFRTRLCKALAVAPDETNDALARAWSDASKISFEETRQFLQTAEDLQQKRNVTEEQLLQCMKECDQLYERSKVHLAVHRGRRLGA